MEQHSDVDSHIGCSCFCNFMTKALKSEDNDCLHTNIKIYQSTRQTELTLILWLRFLSPFAGQRFLHFPQYRVAFCCCFVHPYKSLFNPCSFFACPHYKLLCHLFLVGFSSWSPAFTLHAIRVFSAPALLMAIWRLFSWPQPLACPMGLKKGGVDAACCCEMVLVHPPFTLVTRARPVASLSIFYVSVLPHSSLQKKA